MSNDLGNLKAIQDSIGKIFRFAKDFDSSQKLYQNEVRFDAILMNFIIIGESAGRLSTECKENSSFIQWKAIIGFRNLVAHNYFGVDPEELFDIINNHLPTLKDQIDKLVENS